jgi:hypothetical protein
MSEDAIVGKLRSELGRDIVSECQVVYLLVEVRKLLELRNQTEAFGALTFHCNWALHTRLDKDAAQNLITGLSRCYAGLNEGATAERSFRALWNDLGFDRFRKQFRGFLTSHELPRDICDSDRWKTFLSYYSFVIQDCPLVCSEQGSLGGLIFDKIVLDAVLDEKRRTPASVPAIQIKWRFYLRDALVADWSLQPGQALVGRVLLKK